MFLHVFNISISFSLSSLLYIHFIPSSSALYPCSSHQIYHLKHLKYSASPPLLSHSSSSSCSSTSCWYFSSLWPSGDECSQYILWSLMTAYLLLSIASVFLVFFSDHLTACHCDHQYTPTTGTGPQHRAPQADQGPTNSHCKCHANIAERKLLTDDSFCLEILIVSNLILLLIKH